MQVFDLEAQGLRALNETLHAQAGDTNQTAWEIVNAKGSHAIAVGLDAPIEVTVKGSTGYYCGGMNKQATIKDATAGTFRHLVEAAEKCPVHIIHPGKPKDPNEAGLDELVQRAAKFA